MTPEAWDRPVLPVRSARDHAGLIASGIIASRNRRRSMPLRLWICLLTFLAVRATFAQNVVWEKTGDMGLIFSSENRALYSHPDGDLFAGTIDWLGCGDYCGSEGKVFRSLDGGQTWEQTAYEGDGVTSFAAWPNGDVILSSLERLYRSADHGETWAEMSTPDSWSWNHALHVTADSVIYVGLGPVPGVIGGGLIRSADGGETWEDEIAPPSPMNPFLPPRFNEFLESKGGTLLAASELGIYRRASNGDWAHAGPDSTRIDHLAGLPEGPVYASRSDAVFRSNDGGKTWEAIGVPFTGVIDIAVGVEGDLFAGTRDGLYGSTTNGDDWERLGDAIGALAITSDSHLVSAERLEGGLYRSSTRVLLANEREGEIVPNRVVLEQNYPNPFANRTTIAFELAQPTNVTLEVFDLSGRCVTTLVGGTSSAGRHTLKFHAGELSSGVYIYRLQADVVFRTGLMIHN